MITAWYDIDADDIGEAARALAIGQSVGNPDIRASRDTEALLSRHGARVVDVAGKRVAVEFPSANFGRNDGIAHLLAVLLGGQVDIDYVAGCRLVDVDLGSEAEQFLGPRYGIDGIRSLAQAFRRPLIGGIIKPKLGLSPEQLAEVCREMAEGGVDFIKEDEVLGDPDSCSMRDRVPAVTAALEGFPTIYAPCVTGDGPVALERALMARELGASAVHLNIWTGFGTLKAVREKVDIPLFFQRSGHRVLTSGPYSMSETVMYKIIRLIGYDMGHIGMLGGYLDEPAEELATKLEVLRGTDTHLRGMLPSFSCGAHPGLVSALRSHFGNDILISAGGAIHGHPMGTTAGARAFRQALDARQHSPELDAAIALWGGTVGSKS